MFDSVEWSAPELSAMSLSARSRTELAFPDSALHVLDDAAHLLRIDGLDQPVGVFGQGLQASGERLDRLAEIGEALQRGVDAGAWLASAIEKVWAFSIV